MKGELLVELVHVVMEAKKSRTDHLQAEDPVMSVAWLNLSPKTSESRNLIV
jgi:hypothetical protein